MSKNVCLQRGCTFESDEEKPEVCAVCGNPMIYEKPKAKKKKASKKKASKKK